MNFDELIDRSHSNSSRWGGKGKVLSLTIGDVDFRMPPPIDQALRDRIDHGAIGYDTVPHSLERLIVERLSSQYDWQTTTDSLVFLPGIILGLNLACRAFTTPGQAVVTESPVYPPFLEAPVNSGRELLQLPAQLVNGRWLFDTEKFRELARLPACALLLLCNPQNPLGRVLSPEELAEIAEICLDNDVIICVDEIHCELLYGQQRHQPIGGISEAVSDITVTLMSPSKAYAMSGLGGAFAVIPNEKLRDRFTQVAAGLVPNVNVMALAAMEAAYGQCKPWLIRQLEYLESNRDYLCESLSQIPKVAITVPAATYFIWIDMRRSGLNDPYRTLLDAGLELSEGDRFGGEGFLRLNFASPRARLERAVSIIRHVLS